jgi:tripartite motif-containing protein 71
LIYSLHQVVAKPLKSNPNTLTVVAGTGCLGSASNMLNSPQGIFVDINLDLYVADSYNNRIQCFRSRQFNATTVAGSGASDTIILNHPTGVVLDGNNYLFIVDSFNHRIVGSGPYGFRCLVGCFGAGSAFNQLNSPQSMAFDSYGNMFVTDRANNRVQKFVLSTTSCSKYKNIII